MAHAVSVVLSGTGADGSMGMKRVKEMGGICIVQEPNEAEYSDMPRHSMATGLVDYALPVAAIPAKLISYKSISLQSTFRRSAGARGSGRSGFARHLHATACAHRTRFF
jgi:chemotaxis response regulator CheB